MTVKEARKLFFEKPPILTEEEFENLELVGLTDNGIEAVSDLDNMGVQMVEAGEHFTYVFAIPLVSSDFPFISNIETDEESVEKDEDTNALPDLLFLAHESLRKHS